MSDYDLLIVVTHADLTDIADYWYVAEDKILRDASIARPVNIIVHSLGEVNSAPKRGEYFWVDIARDGIAPYELACHSLVTPMPLTASDAHHMAQANFDKWYPSTGEWLEMAQAAIARGQTGDWPANAAFLLHQAAERCYCCFLLVHTLYFPRSQNIKFLRSLAEDQEPRLIDAWPRSTRLDRSRFERLKRAHVEPRYSPSYAINLDDLTVLAEGVARLRENVDAVCQDRFRVLREVAAESINCRTTHPALPGRRRMRAFPAFARASGIRRARRFAIAPRLATRRRGSRRDHHR